MELLCGKERNECGRRSESVWQWLKPGRWSPINGQRNVASAQAGASIELLQSALSCLGTGSVVRFAGRHSSGGEARRTIETPTAAKPRRSYKRRARALAGVTPSSMATDRKSTRLNSSH